VQATRQLTTANPNLGIILLLAPLAAVPRSATLANGVRSVLTRLDARDADQVYQAIRLADPGGLQPRDHAITRYDVRGPAPGSLLAAMEEAADRDLIARQYTQGFADVLQRVLPWLERTTPDRPLSERIVHAHIRLMSEEADSLIARKCGQAVATEAAARATAVLHAGPPGGEAYWRAVADLDFWLRSDGNRRNPGTTADLIAAALFAGLREGRVLPPYD
jgi:triphosphoribosyl-dephospho-CoA synthase